MIKSGVIKFPRQGCEDLIRKMVGFGVEKHDDSADTFSLLINSTMDQQMNEGTWLISWIGGDDWEDNTVYYSDHIDVG